MFTNYIYKHYNFLLARYLHFIKKQYFHTAMFTPAVELGVGSGAVQTLQELFDCSSYR